MNQCYQMRMAFVSATVLVGVMIVAEGLGAMVYYRLASEYPYDSHGIQIVDFELVPAGNSAIFVGMESDKAGCCPPQKNIGTIDLDDGAIGNSPTNSAFESVASAVYLRGQRPHLPWINDPDAATKRFKTRMLKHFERAGYIGTARFHQCKTQQSIIMHSNSISKWQLGGMVPLWEYHFGEASLVAIDSVDDKVYCAFDSGDVIRLDASTGAIERHCLKTESPILHLSVSPNLSRIALVQGNYQLVFAGLGDDQKPIFETVIGTFPSLNLLPKPAFSSDGRLLIAADPADQSGLIVIESETGSILSRFGPHRGTTGVCWDESQPRIYTWGLDGCIRAWQMDLECQCLLLWTARTGNVLNWWSNGRI